MSLTINWFLIWAPPAQRAVLRHLALLSLISFHIDYLSPYNLAYNAVLQVNNRLDNHFNTLFAHVSAK